MPARLSRAASLACLALIAATPAGATATLDCAGGNGPFKLTVTAAIGQTTILTVNNAGGRVELKSGTVPKDMTVLPLEHEHLAHHWLEGDQLNLYFYRERAANEPFGAIEAVLTTRRVPKSEGEYTGRFKLKISYLRMASDTAPVEFAVTGGVKCMMG